MKKIISGLIATLMVAGALVAFTGVGAANANARYPHSVPTSTRIHAPNHVKVRHTIRVCVNVTSGNTNPKGNVTVRIVRGNGGYKWVRTKAYHGHRVCFRSTKLHPRGAYDIRAAYNARPGSKWKDSDNRDQFRATRRG
ncbi:hypothetical protein [Nocardioides panaciterrulae]|uniref:Ig-like domain-containing protein n=1 Tax=Nocardioides panaciterrulae TaxID=661492 RepID=A0A7Y9J9E3_9ACTN|nr:hypothetical protein [Nocardioides panaciterrulae]NYD40480.1 hypothetical protein [Nocardioides panaciterrulae]